MDIESLRLFFMWCSIINAGLLLVSFAITAIAGGGWVYRMHSRWFPMGRESFNVVIYGLIGFMKTLVLVANVVPWIVLEIIS
ncbi:MAG: DUF6868 family protein [Phycisphaerae bacterium]